ncbi:alternative tryptophan synthase beta-subunit [Microbacterium sp. P26]|uniref:alternative tryptophan synthase beta-subunit n=1 Tax=Microbacterium TaxID=33882 RepID=UPI00203FB8E4|nr:alternative tryptophan synthase beta-subunit [Microbacterium sp. P26]MCM3500427.1 alternative tryptophan synthase beta-subunit [Microbacterium sp. P26]
MTRPRTATHAYRMPGGWQKLPHHALTPDYARDLRDQGFTIVRARRGWNDSRELSLAQYAAGSASGTAAWGDPELKPFSG